MRVQEAKLSMVCYPNAFFSIILFNENYKTQQYQFLKLLKTV